MSSPERYHNNKPASPDLRQALLPPKEQTPMRTFWVPGWDAATLSQKAARRGIEKTIDDLNLHQQALDNGFIVGNHKTLKKIEHDSEFEQATARITTFEKRIRTRIARLNKKLDPISYKETKETNHL